MDVLLETISKPHTSPHEPNDLYIGHSIRQGPLISNVSVPNAMNVLPATVSDGHASRHVPRIPRTKYQNKSKARRNKNMRVMRPMTAAMKIHEELFDGSSLMLDINKKQESIPKLSYSMMHALE